MKRLLTKANGYKKTSKYYNYAPFKPTKPLWEKDGKLYYEYDGKVWEAERKSAIYNYGFDKEN